MKDLKTLLETIKVKDIENDFRGQNIFQGAGIIYVTVKESLGKALGLKKSSRGYIYHQVSTNGALATVEELITDTVAKHNEKYLIKATVSTYLL